MNKEELFKLLLVEKFGAKGPEVEKYFKKFRKQFRNVPSVLTSLNENVLVSEGLKVEDNASKLEFDNVVFEGPLLEIFSIRINLFCSETETQAGFANSALHRLRCQIAQVNFDNTKVFLEAHYFTIHLSNVHKLYEKMIGMLGLECEPTGSDEMSGVRELRNHLEHFEERLEAWISLHCGRPYIDNSTFNNSTVGLKVDQCLRALNVDSEEYFVLGEKYSLHELERLLKIVQKNAILMREMV